MDTLTIPTAFEQEEMAAFLDLLADDLGAVHPMWAITACQHAANARLAADYLRRPCHECAR